MKEVLIAFLCVTAVVPHLPGLTVVPKGGTEVDSAQIQEAPDDDAAELDSERASYDNAANQVHSRIIEVTSDIITDHQRIRIHWTITSEVWIWAFKLRFTYFDENQSPFTAETRWIYSPNDDGSVSVIPPHSPIDEWHELTLPTDQASKFKAVSVLVELAYQPD
jgi:hypothetical protein